MSNILAPILDPGFAESDAHLAGRYLSYSRARARRPSTTHKHILQAVYRLERSDLPGTRAAILEALAATSDVKIIGLLAQAYVLLLV
jgi:hypothetical protein